MPRKKLPEKDFVWTPELAYAVGLLVTDGCLQKDGRHIDLTSKDRSQIEAFIKCLGLTNKIGKKYSGSKKKKMCFRIQFGKIQFYNWLVKIGLTPAKSRTIGPVAVPDEFFRDYFRGCIDGDGTIQTYTDTYNSYKGRTYKTQRLFIRLVSGSEKHIRWLQQRVMATAGVLGFICKKTFSNKKYDPIWELKFAKKKSLRLIEWMYYSPDVPCLQRKKEVAEKAMAIIKNQERKEYKRIAEK